MPSYQLAFVERAKDDLKAARRNLVKIKVESSEMHMRLERLEASTFQQVERVQCLGQVQIVHRFTGLRKEGIYHVCVAAENDIGTSSLSSSAIIKFQE